MNINWTFLSNSRGDFAENTLRRSIGQIIKIISPKLYWRIILQRLRRSESEYELRLAPLLCDGNKTSIDIGADHGPYSVRICEHSAHVVAFEPRPSQAAWLSEMSAFTGLSIKVEAVALSDSAGLARLRILTKDPGRSTIESSNELHDIDGSPQSEILVSKCRLDDYGLHDIGFIKIDVEGHEFAVLRGAVETIRSSMPNFLIEIEERHCANSIMNVSEFLAGLGYEGFFILNKEVKPLAHFNATAHQNPINIGGWKDKWARYGIYVNNFIFLPRGSDNMLHKAIASIR